MKKKLLSLLLSCSMIVCAMPMCALEANAEEYATKAELASEIAAVTQNIQQTKDVVEKEIADEAARLQKEIEAATKQIEEANANIAKNTTEIEKNKAAIEKLSADLKSATEKEAKDIADEIAARTAAVTKLTSNDEKLKDAILQDRKKLEALDKRLVEVEEKWEKAYELYTKNKTKIDNLEKYVKEEDKVLQDQIDGLDTMCSGIMGTLMTQSMSITSMKNNIKVLQAELISIKSDVEANKADIDELQTNLTTLSNNVVLMYGQAIGYTDEQISALKKLIAEQQAQIDAQQTEINKQNTALEELSNKFERHLFSLKQCKLIKAKGAKKAFTVKVKAVTGAEAYRIYYKNVKTKKVTYTESTGTTAKIAKLKRGQKYKVKVCAIKTVGGVKAYSKWSKTATVKVK